MTGDWFTRGDEEAVLWSGQPRRGVAAGFAVVALSAAAVFAVFQPLFGLAALVVGSIGAGWLYLWLANTEYVLTDDAVYRKRGILGEYVSRVELSRVQNTDLRKGVVGTQLGFGTVHVDTAGSSGVELAIRRVPDPERVRELLVEHRKRAAGDALAAGGESVERALEEARELRRVAESLERRFAGGRE